MKLPNSRRFWVTLSDVIVGVAGVVAPIVAKTDPTIPIVVGGLWVSFQPMVKYLLDQYTIDDTVKAVQRGLEPVVREAVNSELTTRGLARDNATPSWRYVVPAGSGEIAVPVVGARSFTAPEGNSDSK